MEDRQSAGLYLELGNATADGALDRARRIASGPGVRRVTAWENCVPGRDDLPMRVTDGSALVVAEVAEGFAAPDAPAGVSAHLFDRHPRPSQGILTGRPTTGLLVVWISPRSPEVANGLRDWADFVHIRHIAAAGIPGFAQISVYENAAAVDPRYMHLYEFDGDDPEATFKTMADHVAPRLGGVGSDEFAAWADWRAPGGRLFYCNTFRLRGEAPSPD
jgi:hypothetical protein